MRTDYINTFATVCVAAHEGLRMYEQTMTVYDFLCAHKGQEFSPKELALAIGKPFVYHWTWTDEDLPEVKRVSDSLHWLLEMGLVQRNTYTKTVEFELDYPTRVRDIKIIDGVEYVGYIMSTKDTVDTTYHKWFVK